jgi:hypothetical protein
MRRAAIRIIKHEAVPKRGSYEVRFSDGTLSRFFYWEDIPGRAVASAVPRAPRYCFSLALPAIPEWFEREGTRNCGGDDAGFLGLGWSSRRCGSAWP